VPAPDDSAVAVFGERLPLARRYAAELAGDGVAHGHVGPREVARLWDRHLTNSAVLTDLLPAGAVFVDVGSGAGLPGVPMAIRRPDLAATLLEPMLRRVRFLTQVQAQLELSNVAVVRGRAEDPGIRASLAGQQWVVARAVAPLDRLVKWCLPLLAPTGRLVALKGSSAAAEVAGTADELARLGARVLSVDDVGARYGGSATAVVVGRSRARNERRDR
jgi:16S rRNA (guanine527-N7)-methyltransferase